MAEQRYYWIKLKTDFFTTDEIDFLMSQKNGAEYVVLYQMLCLMTANNNGRLCTNIGEIIVPYDVEKITRDTKYFSRDTVVVALELFARLNLVFMQDDNVLRIAAFDEGIVGSETAAAGRMRKSRAEKKRLAAQEEQKQLAEQCENIVTQDIRDKSIEIRDKENIYAPVVAYLNEKAGTHYKPTTGKTQQLIRARCNEGFELEDFKRVIDNKCAEWIGTEFEQYLRPETLFGTRFESYLNSKPRRNNQRQQYNAPPDDLEGIL